MAYNVSIGKLYILYKYTASFPTTKSFDRHWLDLSLSSIPAYHETYQRRDERSDYGTNPGAHGRRADANVAHHRRKQFAAEQIYGRERYRRSDYAQRRQYEFVMFHFWVCI